MPETGTDSEDYELLLPAEQPGRLKQSMGQDEQFTKLEGRKGDLLTKYAALTSTGIFMAVTWILVLSNEPTKHGWFALHPLLQSFAVSSFVYGILTLQPTSQPVTKAAGLVRHQVAILLFAIPSIALGSFAVMYHKWLKGANHFTTWHGTFGILVMFWIFVQAGVGGMSVWFNGAAFGGGAKAKAIWKYHRLSGYILLPMLLLTAHFGGAWSNWGAKHGAYSARLIAYTLAPAVLIGSIYARVRVSKMNF